MQAIREKMNNLSIQKKQKIMTIFIIVVLAIFLMSSLLTFHLIVEQKDILPYKTQLKNYISKYSGLQDQYRNFAFYQAHKDLVFRGKMELDENYKKGINNFANITKGQFKDLGDDILHFVVQKKYNQISDFQGNFNYDWSQWDTGIRDDQYLQLGNIFAVVAAIQFHYKIQNIIKQLNNPEVDLSQQQVYDCCQKCRNVSDPKATHYVYEYIKENGLMTQQDYPYTNSIFNKVRETDIKCKYKKENATYFITGYKKVRRNCNQLNSEIEKGPIVVGIDARYLRAYNNDIFSKCSMDKVTHYALLIGKGINYWKLKNNWGSKWGQNGYFKIKDQNSCNICVRATYPKFN